MSAPTETCYHCGADIDATASYSRALGGRPHPFCCAGCMVIARTIHGQGLEAFYTRRLPSIEQPPQDAFASDTPARLRAFDDPALLTRYTRPITEGVAEVTLRLEKIRCAACTA